MADKTSLTEQTDRGQRAEMVLQELDSAFAALEADCFDTFKNSEIHDDDGRLACRIYMRVLDDVKAREVARKSLTDMNNPIDQRNIQ